MSFLDPYKWLAGLILVAILAAGAWFVWWHHGHVEYEAGIAAQRAADSSSLATYTKARDAQLASAEASYHAEIDRLRLHPISLPVVRLCINMPSGAGPGKGTSGPPGAGTGSADIRNVPAGDRPIRRVPNPDISSLLGLLAGRADDTAAQLRALIRVSK